MSDKHKPVDWADEQVRKRLVMQRNYMWRKDSLDMMAKWLNLKPGMTAVDVGCGMGHLGLSFWPYFRRGGHYIGVDISTRLLEIARDDAREWAKGGQVSFVNGHAYNLPLASNSADWAMCQTVLMHLPEPERGLNEMIRVVKPGGLILCIETDIVSSMLIKRYSTLPAPTVDEMILLFKVALHCEKGRAALDRGDTNMGIKVLPMMHRLGLADTEARLADNVWSLLPPYEGEVQQHRLESFKYHNLDTKQTAAWDKKTCDEFLAGGGDAGEWELYMEMTRRQRQLMMDQIEKKQFSMCGSSDVYIVRGRKLR